MPEKVAVELYVYDISHGIAKVFGPMVLGQPIDAVYHTSIVMAGTEYYFGYVSVLQILTGGE